MNPGFISIGLLSKKILINHRNAQGYEKDEQSQMDHKLPRMILIQDCVVRAATSVLEATAINGSLNLRRHET